MAKEKLRNAANAVIEKSAENSSGARGQESEYGTDQEEGKDECS